MNKSEAQSDNPHLRSISAGLRRLAQLAQTHSWRHAMSLRLSPTQQKVIDMLSRREEGLSVSGLAREMGISAATATDSVKTLEVKRLVRKKSGDVDHRTIDVMLTGEGSRAAEQVASLSDPVRVGLQVLDAAERWAFYRSLLKVINGLELTGQLSVSRSCVRCKFFHPQHQEGTAAPHYCQSEQIGLADLDIRLDRKGFVACESSQQAQIWSRFESSKAAG